MLIQRQETKTMTANISRVSIDCQAWCQMFCMQYFSPVKLVIFHPHFMGEKTEV